MKKYCIGSLLLLSAISYSQNKIEKGTYFSNTLGQDIKLNLREDNQYELVVFYGNYEIKNDTLHFNNNHTEGSDFAVSFSSDANPTLGKVKVRLKGISAYYSGIHIGTQTGNSEPNYKSISELAGELNFDETEIVFEISRAEYFYLVKEEYSQESTLYKYALPRSANEIEIEYSPNYLGKVKLEGFLNEKGELVVSEKNKKSPLTFVLESKKPKATQSQVKPLETKTESNWTYPGKTDLLDYGVLDTAAVASDFKLIVQDNFSKALEVTKKTPKKFLVIYYDPNNKNAKADFDKFIKEQQYELSLYNSYEYNEDFDKFNYYLATTKDKSWFEKNKIKKEASLITVDADGTILSQSKGNLLKNKSLFNVYYSALHDNLKKTKALVDFNKTLGGKAKDSEILNAFYAVSQFDPSYDGIQVVEAIAPPAPLQMEGEATDEVIVEAVMEEQPSESEFTKPKFDKARVNTAWEKVIKSHSKDVSPNMQLVSIIAKEIQNIGFSKQLFEEDKLLNETDFQSIDYILKHHDAIIENQNKEPEGSSEVFYSYGNIDSDLNNALSANVSLANDKKAATQYQKKMLELYKKLSEKGTDKIQAKMNYFSFLDGFSQNMDIEKEYVEGYDAFYKDLFEGKGSAIEVLDELYTTRPNTDLSYGYQDWVGYKSSFANLSNQAAWFVVEKSKNAESVKKAIRWSESSLQLEKDNPYYLDTLAQLYYKNGEKQKGIETQERAVKFAENIDESTKYEMESVLEKMKNGTY